MKQIALSLFITIILSLLAGLGLHNYIGFWQGFSCTFVLQIIIGYIFSSIRISKKIQAKEVIAEQIQEFNNLTEVDISCPCGKNDFTTNIYPAIDNIFTCDKCGNTIKVNLSIIPTLVTEAVDISQTFDDLVAKANKKFEEELKEL